jgi:hypothetical protein
MRKINFNCSKSNCLFLALLFVAGTVQAQTKLGNNPKVVQAASLLELESATKGLRLPRIALNDVSQWTLDGTAVSGMLIYNESGSVAKGIYYWNTTLSQWVRVVNTTELTALTLGAPSSTSYANGGYISGNVLYLAYADGTNPGLLSTTNQTFAGAKTFNSNVSVGGTLGVTGNQTNTGSFSQTGTGTFSTGTGAVSLNGATTAAGSLTVTGTTALNGNTTLATGKTLTLTGLNSSLLKTNASGVVSAAVAGTDYQMPITLTSTGTSGVATLSGNTLNIPQYAGSVYTAGTGLTLTGGAFSVNTSQNIATLSNLTSNGLIKTSGGTGALSVAASGTDYAPATSGSSILKGNGAGGFSAAVAGADYQAVLTNPVTATTATPTAGQLAVFASTTDVVTPTTTLPTAAVPAFTGDVTNTAGSVATTLAKLQGTMLSIGTPADGDVLQYTSTGTKWVNTPLSTLGTITLATGTTGTDVNFSASTVGLGGTMTLNIPDAGATSGTRGVVNTGAQTFYGAKTFNSNVSVGGTLGVTGNQTNTGNFSQTGATTFSTGTGAVSLNGATTAAGSLTVTGTTALNGNTTLATGKTLTLTGLNSSLLKTNASGVVSAAVAGTDYQMPITLTSTGTSGAATLFGNTLNIPQYAGSTYTAGTGLTLSSGAFSVNPSQNITSLSNLTSNGLVKTSGATGALSVAVAGTDYQSPISLGTTVDATTANGATFASNVLTLGFATGSYPGLVSIAAQTFAGAKTFNNNVSVGGTLGVTGNQTNTGNFSQTGATTFSTGTGVVSLNGTTTAAGSLTVTGTTALNGNTTLATGKTLTLTGLNSSLLKTNASGVVSAAVAGTDYQMPITLTTTGASGTATFSSNTLNIPAYTLSGLGGIGLTDLSATSPLIYSSSTGAFSIQAASSSQGGYLSNTDWSAFSNKQGAITLTTTGTSGAATLSGNTLNIPQYAGSTYTAGTGLTLSSGAFSVNPSQNISTLSNLTSNGLVKTSGGAGAISIATAGTDYQAPITLTTTGTSGAATLSGNTLNIPQYAGVTYTASNGLTVSSTDVQLGGTLSGATTISQGANNLTFGATTGITNITNMKNTGAVYAHVRKMTTLPTGEASWQADDYIVFISVAGGGDVVLPNPANNPGRILIIRNNSIEAGGSGTYAYITYIPVNNPSIAFSRGQILISDGTKWYLVAGV